MGEPVQSDNVFIGDLPLELSQDGVKSVFSAYGTVVQCRTMPPKRPGQKGSALVRFSSVEEATWVVQNLNGNLAEGLEEPVTVRFANAPGTNQPAQQAVPSWKAPMNAHQTPSASDNLFIGDLPATATDDLVRQVFSAYGTVVQCRSLPPKMQGAKASALVRMSSVAEATWVVNNLNGNLPEGLQEPVVVRFANNNQQNSGGHAQQQTWQNYGAAQKGGKGVQRAQPYNNDNHQGKKFATPQKQGVPESFHAYWGACKKAGVLGENQTSVDCQVYIKNLPTDTTNLDLYRLFSPFGPIAPNGVKAMSWPDGTCKGFGFVDFLDASHAEAAIAAIKDFTMPDGTMLEPSTKARKDGAQAPAGKGSW